LSYRSEDALGIPFLGREEEFLYLIKGRRASDFYFKLI
jgi:hypothetical protein